MRLPQLNRTVVFSALTGCLLAGSAIFLAGQGGIPCMQGNDCILGGGTTIGGSTVATMTGPMTLVLNGTLGNDSSSCTGTGANACKTIAGAVKKIPGKRILFPVTITDEIGGNYSGFHLESYTFEPWTGNNSTGGGAYIQVKGVNKLAFFSGLPSTGATGSATQLSGNNFATLTVLIGGWAANQTRGFMLNITSGTGAGQTRVIYGNTATVLTIAGSWAVTPDNTSSWQILDPCNGGAIMVGDPTINQVQAPSIGFASANTTPGTYTDMFFANNQQAGDKPQGVRGSSTSSKGGSIYITNFCFQGVSTEVATIRNSPGVVLQYNRMNNQTPASGCYITSDSPNTVLGNNYATASVASQGFDCLMNGGNNLGSLLDGNVLDAMALAIGTSGPGGPFNGTGIVNVVTSANSVQNLVGEPAISLNSCNECSFTADKIETTTGGAGPNGFCVAIGCGVDANSLCRGAFSSGVIAGGFYNGCATGGLLLAGGFWNLRTTALTGTSTAGFGVDCRRGCVLDNNAALATITGPSGDTTLDEGNTALSWANAATFGRTYNRVTGSILINAAAGATVGKSLCPRTDTSGSPGSATANTPCGKSAIANGANTATITNSQVTATSNVNCTPATANAGVATIVCVAGAGSFTATAVNAAGTPTNTTAPLSYTWSVDN